jgi:hypothetical protein
MTVDRDDSVSIIKWRLEQRGIVEEYLADEEVSHSPVPLIPEFAVAPYISLWHCKPDLWVVAGDLPTDYFVLPKGTPVRAALGAFADRWARAAQNMLDGQPDPELTIGDPDDREEQLELGELLGGRAELLRKMADDDEAWDNS